MEESAKPTPVLEKEDNPPIFNRILKIAAFPVAALSGLWVVKKEVNEAVYENLKRYHAFDDILEELQPKNDANVKARIASTCDIEEFLSKSTVTRNAYRTASSQRMAHFGLGNSLKDFPNQWQYARSDGKRNAIIQGMTVAGIAIGALLTIANSKSLVDYFAGDKDKGDKSP